MSIKCFLMEFVSSEVNGPSVWKCVDNGNLITVRSHWDLPVGSVYRATWLEEVPKFRGIDGQSWIVITPGGGWTIDGKASNCTKPDDLIHKCWCRHGTAPNFTVDKNGNTCNAGAGSIAIGDYHGHLINGELT